MRFQFGVQHSWALPAEESGGGYVVQGHYPRKNPTQIFTCRFDRNGNFRNVRQS